MTAKLTTRVALAAMMLSLPLAGLAHAEQKQSGGPTQSQIDCQNRAVNDYYDQIKACDQVLSDLPDQNALCHNDAAADLSRNKAACTAAMTTGGQGVLGTGGVLDATQGTTQPKTKLKLLTPKVFNKGVTTQ
jgi:hypothetical protein